MLRNLKTIGMVALLMLVIGGMAATAQDYNREESEYYDNERASIDRYLDVEVWTDHSDAEYFVGDRVKINFRANRDAFVAIYSVDTRGMVNLMYPTDPAEDNFVRGGVTYTLPGANDDFDLVVNGPEGTETIQVIASRERFPIPNWYNNSGLVDDAENRNDFMDYLNERYFVRYDGQRFAYDRAVIFVEEWEPSYFRPVHYPYYPSWSVVGNVYLDYDWGSSVYINGHYWGCTPLYIPRILVGWHTVTICDRWGYYWEHDFHVSRYNTVVFNHNIIRPLPTVRSKYKTVRSVGYRDPVSAGYTKFHDQVALKKNVRVKAGGAVVASKSRGATKATTSGEFISGTTKYARGSTKMVKTDRGYETRSITADKGSKYRTNKSSYGSKSSSSSKGRTSATTGSSDYKRKSSSSTSGSSSYKSRKSSTTSSGSSSGYYQKKSGSSSGSKAKSGSYKKKSSSSTKGSKTTTTTGSKSSTKKSSKATKSKVNQGSSKKSSSSNSSVGSKSSKSSKSSSGSTSMGRKSSSGKTSTSSGSKRSSSGRKKSK